MYIVKRIFLAIIVIGLVAGVGWGLKNTKILEKMKGMAFPFPDLQIGEVRVNTVDLKAGDIAMLAVKVSNLGREEAAKFFLKVSENEVDLKSFAVGKELKEGESVLINVAVDTKGLKPGEHSLDLEVDSKHEVVEENEANNKSKVMVKLQ